MKPPSCLRTTAPFLIKPLAKRKAALLNDYKLALLKMPLQRLVSNLNNCQVAGWWTPGLCSVYRSSVLYPKCLSQSVLDFGSLQILEYFLRQNEISWGGAQAWTQRLFVSYMCDARGLKVILSIQCVIILCMKQSLGCILMWPAQEVSGGIFRLLCLVSSQEVQDFRASQRLDFQIF